MAHKVHTTERLTKLRDLMRLQENNVQAYVVPSEDQHASEYIAACDERRAFISGFNGSAGCAVVTLNEALLFTDGRYFLQAEQQLDNNWTLMRQGLPDVPTWQEYLAKLPSSRIGIDPTLILAQDASNLSKTLAPKESSLASLPINLVDQVWGTDRPSRPKNALIHLPEKYSGESYPSKLQRLRAEMAKKEADVFVVTALDEIAWLFNLRGTDIAYNPVFFAYAVVPAEGKAVLFLQTGETVITSALGAEDVEVRGYEEIWEFLKGMEAKKVLIGDKASLAIGEAVGEERYTIATSPLTHLKSIKNSVELDGFRNSHIRDGVALVKYFSWLENELNEGREHSEWNAAEKLEAFRKELDLFQGLSFDTISSAGPNGAIIHYSPDPEESAIIKKDQVYLCDSGAQFLDGTTDVTRTWHFGTPSEEEKRAFTRVLQGHIALDRLIFPNGTTGYIIDAFARSALWKDGLDFRHGTGHGVGHFLNVHEGPHGIGARIGNNANPLKAGMTITNEPGYYADGKFGIRIENVMLVQECETPNNFGEKGYLRFENVTMCPIQTKMIVKELMTVEEMAWLNQYHKLVWQKLSPLVEEDEITLAWLKKECSLL